MTPTKGSAPVVPKLSAPLTKLIRTGEGIILFAFNLLAAVGAVVNDVSPAQAIKYAAIFNAVAFASRTFLKAVAATKGTIGTPLQPAILGRIEQAEPAVATGIEDVAAEIKAGLPAMPPQHTPPPPAPVAPTPEPPAA